MPGPEGTPSGDVDEGPQAHPQPSAPNHYYTPSPPKSNRNAWPPKSEMSKMSKMLTKSAGGTLSWYNMKSGKARFRVRRV